ncbi:Nucleoside-diphosphate-sugar epimerase [Amycolatopsis arida]|uniref:Nucleoside-diphosphate-sugar epimerase n=1 Tax=Amycolatopsis arida TaxID=587909 RepID=A0A1I5XQ98_9PSEU|nr:NAD-dependent epimerase/dehydratase family protein [Amycolatopsis arida]TDX97319.1 nucleoside-diphosphate-sugar epimerase [Amycolatopsis arida]SFQ34132.1 Nucleoside-diphosphate-sugar epimerase [Amycolatopsis arida]
MRVVVLGGTGHIGTYLVPRLVAAGHDVVVVCRARREPYTGHGAWRQVTTVPIDRDTAEAEGTFGARVADLAPDAVIDLICFTPPSARQLVDALRGRIRHFLHCGTIWVHGPSTVVPTAEDGPRRPIAEYGRNKAAIEEYLHRQAQLDGFPATVVHPGHITGPGWAPVNPAGNINPDVFQRLADGRPLPLPNHGMETVQHVHADDVARMFVAALANRAVSVGESFHAVAATALTLRGYAEAVAAWFGRPATLEFQPWEQWRGGADPEDARITYDHLAHSPHCAIEKARRLLGFEPRYTSLEAVREAVDALVAVGHLRLG